MNASIALTSVSALEQAPNLQALLDEYAEESGLAELGAASPCFDIYSEMERVGAARVIGAYVGFELVGFLVLLISVVPHFGKRIASTESFFVAKAARATGAGLRLLHAAECMARDEEAIGLFVSSPVDGVLAQVLPSTGYRETNRLFFRDLTSTAVAVPRRRISKMSDEDIERTRDLEAMTRDMPNVYVPTSHVLHGGLYSRTIRIPAGIVMTGALIRVPTLLIVNGDATLNDDEGTRLTGYHVIAASAGRRQVFLTHAETTLTMIFSTNAKTVQEAEDEFTVEADILMSRATEAWNDVTITGEER